MRRDIYVTPYGNEAQISSGTLAYAVGSGKAVVSTPYWYAAEMLAEERGRIVPFNDPEALAEQVIDLFDKPVEANAMRKRAYVFGRDAVWPEVAQQYLRVFAEAREERTQQSGTLLQLAGARGRFRRRARHRLRPPAPADRPHRHPAARDLQRPRPTPRLLHRRQRPGAGRHRAGRATPAGGRRPSAELRATYLAFLQYALDEATGQVPQLPALRPAVGGEGRVRG